MLTNISHGDYDGLLTDMMPVGSLFPAPELAEFDVIVRTIYEIPEWRRVKPEGTPPSQDQSSSKSAT